MNSDPRVHSIAHNELNNQTVVAALDNIECTWRYFGCLNGAEISIKLLCFNEGDIQTGITWREIVGWIRFQQNKIEN